MKTKLYSLAILLLTAVATILRSICLLTRYEPNLGYLQPDALSVATAVLLAAGVLVCLISLWILPQAAFDQGISTKPRTRAGWAILYFLSAACCFFGGLYFLTNRASNSIVFYILIGVFSISFAMFFLMNCSQDATKSATASATLSPWLCLTGILALIFLLASSYFDMTVALNGPFAAPFYFSVIFSCLFLLAEARVYAGRSPSRLHLALTYAAFFLGTSVGISNLIFSLLGDAANGVTIAEPARALLLLAIPFATVARLLRLGQPTAFDEQPQEFAE